MKVCAPTVSGRASEGAEVFSFSSAPRRRDGLIGRRAATNRFAIPFRGVGIAEGGAASACGRAAPLFNELT